MTISTAMSILFDPDGFWPQSFHESARQFVQENGSEEQKALLGKETIVKESQRNRLSTIDQHLGNKRMGATP